ncbi:MAG: tRNA ((37)-N6)-threonylcarbamoyltransferase complex dimerization subunit type 1 TsaB [Rhodoferax sp.]|nr:tRNA ((37)-N6)-threonylcarbamoyltransferase complex dimerization subunit type 1 TsaB [Rhodoferax sp.]
MKLLAFDTSTDQLSIAVTDGVRTWQHDGAGGAKASATLIPAVMALLAEAGLKLAELDAIAFGAGPGSFTGLRTACAVAQGLAFGARRPVLPVDTLMAVAEEARHRCGAERVVAVLDARMDEMYSSRYAWHEGGWQAEADFALVRPEALDVPEGWTLAGNAMPVYGERFPQRQSAAGGAPDAPLDVPRAQPPDVPALPTAMAMLRLAPALLAAGGAVNPSDALPRYIRDKVAQTTAERLVIRQAAADAAAVASAAASVAANTVGTDKVAP